MSIYQYDQPSKLEKIAIRKTAGGGSRCFLFARDGLSAPEAAKIRETLDNAHFACVPSDVNGDNCLEVRGCKNVKLLENILRPAGILQGNARVDHSDNERFSLSDKVRNNLVSLYGVINVVADMGIIAYGHMKQKLSPEAKGAWSDKAAGYAYSIGSLTFTAFGKGDKSDYQARDVALKLRAELQGRGIELPVDSAAMSFSESRRMGLGKKVGNYLAKHGAEAGNIATGTAGAFMLNSAYNSKQSSTKVMDGLLGATTLLSGYGAALVKEKAPDPEHPPTTVTGKVKQWVEERPNRLAGYGYMISTVIHGVETVKHYAKAEEEHPGKVAYARKAYAFRGAFTVLNLIGEFMLTAASKGHGSGVRGSTIEDTALAIVADAVVRQPQVQRDALIKDLGAQFLSNPDVLGGDGAELTNKLMQRVHKLENNPWLISRNSTANNLPAKPQPTQSWAKAKNENYVAAIDKSRELNAERTL